MLFCWEIQKLQCLLTICYLCISQLKPINNAVAKICDQLFLVLLSWSEILCVPIPLAEHIHFPYFPFLPLPTSSFGIIKNLLVSLGFDCSISQHARTSLWPCGHKWAASAQAQLDMSNYLTVTMPKCSIWFLLVCKPHKEQEQWFLVKKVKSQLIFRRVTED